MEQKDYKLEIVGILLKKENHIRAIAKELKINHMMVVRKIKELLDLNVVDFKKNGKNNTYFLKKNIEARGFILMFESYNLLNFIRKYKFLKEIVEKIQKDKQIKLALFFGSYVKNLVRKESDIDLYMDTLNLDLKKKYCKLNSKLSIKVGKFDLKNDLIKEIKQNHVLIKGGEEYYEKVFE